MATLPEDILYNILARLPAKFLLRFKCVSKDWYNLINSPTFINLHHKRVMDEAEAGYNADDIILVVSRHRDNHFYAYFDFDVDVPKAANGSHFNLLPHDIVGSCNGLICLKGHRGELALCNFFNLGI